MSGSGTIYTEQSMLGHTLGFAPMAFPARVYVGLCSAAMPPSETVQGVEAFGNGYARQQATFALIATPANIAANVATVEYPMASGGWGTLGFFELWDAPVGGNRLYWGALIDTASQLPITITVGSGDIVRFSAGTLAVQATTGAGGTSTVGAYLPLAGGTLTGPLLLAADPTTYLQAATKQYVDAHSGTGGGPGFLSLSGGTMLGPITLAANAAAALQAVPLQQVPVASSTTPAMNGTAAIGVGTTWARADHAHPSDTSRMPIAGTITNDNAAAGNIGQYVSAGVVQGSAIALTTNVAINVTSISLTAGDWDVNGSVDFYPAGTTTTSQITGGINTASATLPVRGTSSGFSSVTAAAAAGAIQDLQIGRVRLSLAATTTVYLVAVAQFAVSTMTAGGFIMGRRVR